MKTLDKEHLIKLIRLQMNNADLWINEWERHKDLSSIRNAAFAIGKMAGIYNVLLSVNGMEDNVPDEIIELVVKYTDIWHRLYVGT